MRLKGKVAIVTGGGRGIGRAIALVLAREGADIAIFDYDLQSAGNIAEEIESAGRKALLIKCDVSILKEVTKAVNRVINKFKKIHILVNNAGISPVIPALNTSEDEWDRTININLKGQFLCCQAVARHMIKQKYGKIVNIASTIAHVATPNLAAYAASKGGVLALSRELAVEWAEYGINVNVVSPGFTDTEMNREIARKDPDFLTGRIVRIPQRRINNPEDLANAILFLVSSESDNITGQFIAVDGGVMALHSAYMWPREKSKS